MRCVLLAASDFGGIFTWSLILVGGLVVMCMAAVWLRRWMSREEPAPTGFTLADLRELHRQGKISAEEYERARTRMVQATSKENPTSKGPSGPIKN